MNITYKIEFFSNWHCGSGLSAGADVDLLVIKDKTGLPFVPGKTMKGLIKEAVETIDSLSGNKKTDFLKRAFGYESKTSALQEADSKGVCYFSNATLETELKNAIGSTSYCKHLYHALSSTAIDEHGVAKEHSLRRMEVCIPCTLIGEIVDVPKELEQEIENGLKYIKRLGQNRNRGLGRCSISIIAKKENAQ